MEINKVLCYSAIIIAGLVTLIFLLDATLGLMGRISLVLDILFIIAGAFVLWQGLETARAVSRTRPPGVVRSSPRPRRLERDERWSPVRTPSYLCG